VPTYSYRCTECDNAFDIHQSFADDTLTVCPVCGGKLRKVFSPIGVTFNGSGFYRTDSRAKPASGGSKEGAGSSTTSTSESKPAASGTSAPAPAAKPASKPASTSSTGGSTSSS
jgi:putative FmdB family regulatory protein